MIQLWNEEPNFENLHGLLSGSIKLNSSADLHVFTAGKFLLDACYSFLPLIVNSFRKDYC